MPEHVETTFAVPDDELFGDAGALLVDVATGIAAVEDAARAARADTGRKVLGRKRGRAQSWRDAPASVELRRCMRPRFASRRATPPAALAGYRDFLARHRDARERWRLGPTSSVQFSIGTYALLRTAPVTAAPLVAKALPAVTKVASPEPALGKDVPDWMARWLAAPRLA